jgi:hypothetical protein
MPRKANPEHVELMREQVEAMASFGIPQDKIAVCLKISPVTLRKRYPEELATGATKASALVAQNLFCIATGEGREAVTAAIFWLKTRARWSEVSRSNEVQAPKAKLGKKAAAQAEAQTAHEDSEWGSILQ